MKGKYCIFLVLIFLAAACNITDKKPASPEQLAGLWVTSEGPLLYEEWWKTGSNELTGRSFSINQGDTFHLEAMRMAVSDGKLHFFARVPDQNQEKEVGFALVQEVPGSWIFENPSHDYPNRIIYQLVSDTSLYARIENTKGNKKKEFRFRRIGL